MFFVRDMKLKPVLLNELRSDITYVVRVFIIDEGWVTYYALISHVASTARHAAASIAHSKVN